MTKSLVFRDNYRKWNIVIAAILFLLALAIAWPTQAGERPEIFRLKTPKAQTANGTVYVYHGGSVDQATFWSNLERTGVLSALQVQATPAAPSAARHRASGAASAAPTAVRIPSEPNIDVAHLGFEGVEGNAVLGFHAGIQPGSVFEGRASEIFLDGRYLGKLTHAITIPALPLPAAPSAVPAPKLFDWGGGFGGYGGTRNSGGHAAVVRTFVTPDAYFEKELPVNTAPDMFLNESPCYDGTGVNLGVILFNLDQTPLVKVVNYQVGNLLVPVRVDPAFDASTGITRFRITIDAESYAKVSQLGQTQGAGTSITTATANGGGTAIFAPYVFYPPIEVIDGRKGMCGGKG